MKKYLIIILLFFCMFVLCNLDDSYSYVDCSNSVIKPVEVTSLNFVEYMSNIEYNDIYKICSYDYCFNFYSGDLNESILNFTKIYYKSIDYEDQLILMVKGIPITEIVINNCK